MKDITLRTVKNQVQISVNNLNAQALFFDWVDEVSCEDSQPEVTGRKLMGTIKGVLFINCTAIVSHVKLLDILPVFTSRGLSIWQQSTRLA